MAALAKTRILRYRYQQKRLTPMAILNVTDMPAMTPTKEVWVCGCEGYGYGAGVGVAYFAVISRIVHSLDLVLLFQDRER
mmetsp:Transcript_13610/g.25972  ORF Transcript_13610/g.25972 Transcript_13610/m.25972 type:complete len:80 (+) Transcript_13610:334-573(+)